MLPSTMLRVYDRVYDRVFDKVYDRASQQRLTGFSKNGNHSTRALRSGECVYARVVANKA